jgi:hypothetical protein
MTRALRTFPLSRNAVATVVAAVLVSMLLGAGPASAATYWSTGTVANASVPRGTCRYYDGWGRLDAMIAAPSVYAADLNHGAGNDAAYVRYRAFAVDRYGRTVQSSGYSGWAIAYDNKPATWSGTTVFQDVPNVTRIDIRIEWWAPNTMIGALAYRVTSYDHYVGQMGPMGPMESCGKYAP